MWAANLCREGKGQQQGARASRTKTLEYASGQEANQEESEEQKLEPEQSYLTPKQPLPIQLECISISHRKIALNTHRT